MGSARRQTRLPHQAFGRSRLLPQPAIENPSPSSRPLGASRSRSSLSICRERSRRASCSPSVPASTVDVPSSHHHRRRGHARFHILSQSRSAGRTEDRARLMRVHRPARRATAANRTDPIHPRARREREQRPHDREEHEARREHGRTPAADFTYRALEENHPRPHERHRRGHRQHRVKSPVMQQPAALAFSQKPATNRNDTDVSASRLSSTAGVAWSVSRSSTMKPTASPGVHPGRQEPFRDCSFNTRRDSPRTHWSACRAPTRARSGDVGRKSRGR